MAFDFDFRLELSVLDLLLSGTTLGAVLQPVDDNNNAQDHNQIAGDGNEDEGRESPSARSSSCNDDDEEPGNDNERGEDDDEEPGNDDQAEGGSDDDDEEDESRSNSSGNDESGKDDESHNDDGQEPIDDNGAEGGNDDDDEEEEDDEEVDESRSNSGNDERGNDDDEEPGNDDHYAGGRNEHHWLLCPISLSLPQFPVKADDGRVYEKHVIEQYFENCRAAGHGTIRSPVTTERMSDRLEYCKERYYLIVKLIFNGTLDRNDEMVKAWRNNHFFWKAGLVSRAKKGDVGAMLELVNFSFDCHKDACSGLGWLEKAHSAGCLYASEKLGARLLTGIGLGIFKFEKEKNHKRAFEVNCAAAEAGSVTAAYYLGFQYMMGLGTPRSKYMAIFWLEKALTRGEDLPEDQYVGWTNELDDETKFQILGDLRKLRE
ncbi:expressed unknown protein [Seminavis robusta]|uniref:U-box domain-containing protein n=1 Tax=Seminavis robusta TaxID=568900 RepID=A0A9N8DSZ0_9STRA|nr:expressed unknown protein [Seminavis robusta]|eukprot:Sro256_g100570.1 n/a (431) ;mRNA; r:15247-16851